MKISLNNIGKRYRFEWIFRNISCELNSGTAYAISGPNGSGKSTFLKILCGHLTPSKGNIQFQLDGKTLDVDNVYSHVSYAAPYIELIEELTLLEAIRFHGRFKPMMDGLQPQAILELMQLQSSRDKEIRFFSSGMKQRLKLALAFCSDTRILLLDEPTTNLDQQGVDWYLEMVRRFKRDRLVVVASNVAVDFAFCQEKMSILDYKKKSTQASKKR
ncbi:MAG: ABC transporter ATP-binding protein [Bacteroidota bacterium]